MSIARTPSLLIACLALDWPCAWVSANDSADCPMATAAAADTPAFNRLRRDTPAAQLHPSDVFIGFLLDNNSGGLPFWIQGKQVEPAPVMVEKLSGGPVWSIYQIGDSAGFREVENALPAFLTNVEWISILIRAYLINRSVAGFSD